MGVIHCDHLVILFSVCTQMSEKERDIVIPLFVRGFRVLNMNNEMFKYIS